jgi:hypothetical protein
VRNNICQNLTEIHKRNKRPKGVEKGGSICMGIHLMSNLYRGPSIDASYQVSVHLAEGFQRRRLKCEKLTDDGRQVMAKAHIAFVKVSSKCIPIHMDPPFSTPLGLLFAK